jgi:hypothetical protein
MAISKYKGLSQLFPLNYYRNMNSRFFCLFLLLSVCIAIACEKGEETSFQAENPALTAGEASGEGSADQRAEENRGEAVLRALASAYPDRVNAVEFHDGDWSILVYGERFYFAGGRLLPSSLRDDVNLFAPMPFYFYQQELPPWVKPTPEESARMREQDRARAANRLKRSTHFTDALWRSRNGDEAWEHIKQIRFLGVPVQVHYSILVQLSLVEEQILRASKTSSAVRQWINNLASVEGWTWRNIATSENRSYHAYGAAIDLVPKSSSGLEIYWLWTSGKNIEWWTVPYSGRLHPPDEVIKAFESFGFIWGGKWRYYDTIHFEYRPELLVLSGMEITDLRDLR